MRALSVVVCAFFAASCGADGRTVFGPQNYNNDVGQTDVECHIIDGDFSTKCVEWAEAPLSASTADFYFDYAGGRLHLLIDQHSVTSAPQCQHTLALLTAGGSRRWVIDIHDDHAALWLNGEAVPESGNMSVAARGFRASADHQAEHPIVELSLPVQAGSVVLKVAESCSGALPAETTVFQGEVSTADGAVFEAATGPVIYRTSSHEAGIGESLTLIGANLGHAVGSVYAGDLTAQVVSWSSEQVVVEVPYVENTTMLHVATADGSNSNPLKLRRASCHVVDGSFTDPMGCPEWPDPPIVGVYGDLYLSYRAGKIYLLNDWHLRDDAPVEEESYNLFNFATAGGLQVWQVHVHPNHIRVWLNGLEIPEGEIDAAGATGFGPSKNHPKPHAIFEFALPAEPGGLVMNAHDPGPWSFVNGKTGADALVEEPTIIGGTLGEEEGAAVGSTEDPVLFRISPAQANPGDTITLFGRSLGSAAAKVTFGHVEAQVISWQDDAVQIVAPDFQGWSDIRAETADGTPTNTLGLVQGCIAQCGDRVCGDDGCGGSCGTCTGAQTCTDGACACVPTCNGKACGSDGCGGTCGVCGEGTACVVNQCVCAPDCSGTVCGPDGCGGLCDACPGTLVCDGAQCCEPQCDGKTCGADGCGGSCGACGDTQTCDGGQCICLPNCQGKQCGSDGCGGSCGGCGSQEVCQGGLCVCTPKCAGKECGDNGCGGVCGSCDQQSLCTDGQCICVPSCDAKACGGDGCGGSCGECGEGDACQNNQCVCAPKCANKNCGSDGCGGSCGTCGDGQMCSKISKCIDG